MNARTLALACAVVLAGAAQSGNVTDRLRVEPVLTIPKPGAVRPSGWLLRQAQAQRDGATARMDEVDVQFRRAWAAATCPRGKDLKWHADPGAWSCEGGAYWFDGLVKLAWQLDDPALKAMASNRLETVLSKMPRRPIGFCWWLGRDDPACVREVKEDNWLLWVAGMFERPVSAWYEATGDRRVPEVLRRVFDGHVFDYGNLATTPSAAVDAWRLTGDAQIAAANDRQFARLAGGGGFLRPAERQYYTPPPKYLEETLNLRRRHQNILGIPTRHGVIASETLLSVFRTYQWTGDERWLKAVRAWYAFFDTHMRQPCGVTTMDEEWGYPGPGRGTETCVVAAEGWTRINLLAGLGEGVWGDDVERNFFNAGLACATVDYRRHVYMQQPNRTVSNELSQCSFSGDPGEFLGRYDPKHWPLCCTAALNRILPNFIQAMWMTTADGGVAATLYGPCSFETELPSGRFSAVEDTRYPFEETIRLRIRAAPAAALPLSLRLPAWCAAPEIAVNGTRTDVAPDGKGFARIVRQWTPGDIVTLRFPQRTERRSMRDLNLGQFGRRYDYFTRGPLLLASPVPAEDANTPIVPAEVPAIDEKTTAEELGLVPYGTVKLRVSMFPVEAHTEQPMRLDPIFADGLVLAAGKPVRVFGTGDGVVCVTFLGRTAEARSADGRWLVELPPAEKGGPHGLTVELNGRKTVLRNVRVGEVYLLAGQSNLQFKLKSSSTPKADYRDEPDVRMFSLLRLQRGERFHPADGWVACRRENAGDWSAIGYHFGRERRAASGGAVGVVNCYQGASVIQSWMPEALANDPAFALEPGDLHADFTMPAYMSWNSPGTLYRQMFRRVVPFSFTGVVWYQGESNTGAGEHRVYADELAAMITAWRRDLRDADLPFCVVQIADFDRRRDPAWKRLQDAQGRIGEKVGGVTVVRSADVCESNDIHPASKAALARRISEACGTRRGESRK